MFGTALLHFLLLCCLLSVSRARSVDVYMREELTPAADLALAEIPADYNVTSYSLTDGSFHVSVSGDHGHGVLLHCDISSDSTAIHGLQANYRDHVTVDEKEWAGLLSRCNELNDIYTAFWKGVSRKRVGNEVRKKREVKRSGRTTARPTYVPAGNKLGNLFILNGTIWCGTGNKATSFDDLGLYPSVDKCCRSHDYCRDFIPMLSTKYKYSNRRPYTISHCECDYDFYRCLKIAGTDKADEIGDIFFDTVGVPCFNFEYGKVCLDETSYIFCGKSGHGTAVSLNFVLSRIWSQEKLRISLRP